MNQDVIEALENQVGCYRRLAKLVDMQHDHVEQNQMESLLDVLRDRQAVVDQITRLEAVLGPVRKDWNAFVLGMDARQRSEAEGYLAEAKQLLETITTSDRNDAMLLQQRKLNLGRQIDQTTSARQVNRNYAMAAYGRRPSQMDVQR